LIKGSAALNKPMVSGQKIKRADGYKQLAMFVNRRTGATWTDEQGKSRYQALESTYKKAKQLAEQTGFGVTEEDRLKNIFTVEAKLESLCMFFSELDALFGHRQNVASASTMEPAITQAALEDTPAEDTLAITQDVLEDTPAITQAVLDDTDGESEEFDVFSDPISLEDHQNTQAMVNKSRSMSTSSSTSSSSSSSTSSSTKKSKRSVDISTLVMASQESRVNMKREELDQNRQFKREELAQRREELVQSRQMKREELDQSRQMKREELDLKKDELDQSKEMECKRLDLEERRLKAGIIQSAFASGKSMQEIEKVFEMLQKLA
jgi:hypothetical protein